ncbi:mobile mystery protein B [Candidatus Margulisiibacteriota bacterium]
MEEKLINKLNQNIPEGATPLEEEEIEELIPGYITTRIELYDAEFKNTLEAFKKYSNRKFDFTIPNLHKLHKEMFSYVWKWAGRKRTTNKNIGVDKFKIDTELKKIIDDYSYWITHKKDPIDISVFLHHRLVKIHPYNNGNGRWARLATNLILQKLINKIIIWPEDDLFIATEFRHSYIKSLHEADKGNYELLKNIHIHHLQKD